MSPDVAVRLAEAVRAYLVAREIPRRSEEPDFDRHEFNERYLLRELLAALAAWDAEHGRKEEGHAAGR